MPHSKSVASSVTRGASPQPLRKTRQKRQSGDSFCATIGPVFSSRVNVCASVDLLEGKPRIVYALGKVIALVRVDGVAYAIDNACPHGNGELGRGDLQGHHLYCPLHAWCFDVRNGQAFFPQGARVRCFRTTEEDGQVWIERRGP